MCLLQSVYTFPGYGYHATMDQTSTSAIVAALTSAIVEHRLLPGEKLAEQKLADQFGVSRTLVRQALYQLAQNRLITLEPARGAFVAAPSETEAHQVFAVRRLLEAGLVRDLVAQASDADLQALQRHLALQRAAVERCDVVGRTNLLGDFHVHMAQRIGNQVLAELLGDLLSRCALITLKYQSGNAAAHSLHEHTDILAALQARDAERAVQLMDAHLLHVEQTLEFQPPQACP